MKLNKNLDMGLVSHLGKGWGSVRLEGVSKWGV